ncbi:RxLR-like protein [Plasmopara halstedii]|uniref:RxLR-like protein n=1 Tax=Plasmopara halstedii TaxID=4781 RepID=A0A0P1B3D5_PLAHL|nr:RxLR-like protein [Plasmopara halstedii]CEG49269.1 RxLR-like protein [Plasmopara halstedii]|eukprot:XP_024585638.1 RxLR-like protein [Plasmopara halstedii]
MRVLSVIFLTSAVILGSLSDAFSTTTPDHEASLKSFNQVIEGHKPKEFLRRRLHSGGDELVRLVPKETVSTVARDIRTLPHAAEHLENAFAQVHPHQDDELFSTAYKRLNN